MARQRKDANPNPDLKMAVEFIVRERAKSELDESIKLGINPRGVNISKAESIGRDMLSGNFELNGETIKYNTLRKLIDGQNRHWACVWSGVEGYWTAVAYGVHCNDNIDTGSARHFGLLLRSKGVKNFGVVAGALSLIYSRKFTPLGWGTIGHRKPNNAELMNLYEQSEGIEQMTAFCRSKLDVFRKPSMMTAFSYVANKIDPVLTKWFIENLCTGDKTTSREPAHVLRQILLNSNIRGSHLGKYSLMSSRHKLALMIIAWNMTHEQRPVTGAKGSRLEWFESGPKSDKSFPILHGDYEAGYEGEFFPLEPAPQGSTEAS